MRAAAVPKGAKAMLSQKLQAAALFAAASLLAASPALAADQNQEGQGSAVITILSGNEIPGGIPQDALHLKVDGKDSNITGWTQLRSPQSKVQMVVLIDDGARSSLGIQLSDIAKFIQGLPRMRVSPWPIWRTDAPH